MASKALEAKAGCGFERVSNNAHARGAMVTTVWPWSKFEVPSAMLGQFFWTKMAEQWLTHG
jgi:hypothetical protein